KMLSLLALVPLRRPSPTALYTRHYTGILENGGRSGCDAPAAYIVTIVLRNCHHVRTPFYRAPCFRQACLAVPGLPPVRACLWAMGQENPGQDALLRRVGRSRRRPARVPRTEGRPARRAQTQG